ncbi:MAG: hypothetical protein CSB47_09585 [Proteobacteria bacterium]|nr:MAG: hypothetical protein CSB47_09585 [Pseudomonadota bacterium]
MMKHTELKLRLVSSTEQFEALEESWNELSVAAIDKSIFASWDWLFTWWEVFSECDSRDLFILCFYDQDLLVGIAPFQIARKYPHSYIQGRTLRFLASGEQLQDSIATPFLDLLARDGYQHSVVLAVEKAVIEYQHRWDFADFEFLLETSLITQCFQQNSGGINRRLDAYGYRCVVPQVDTQEEYLETLPKRWQKDYRKSDRLFHKNGELEIKTAEFERIDESLALLKDMHCERWAGRADFLVFESEKFNQFHRKILRRLLPKGKAYIRTLCFDGHPMSTYYAFEGENWVHYYQSAFYQKNANRYMPLLYMLCNEIGSAMERGKHFDFMFTDSENSYKKYQYSAEATPMFRLLWTPSRFRLLLLDSYRMYKRVWLRLKDYVVALRKKLAREQGK